MVPARWRIDEVADSTGISLPEAPEYDTVSGLVMRELGRVPEVGDRLEVGLTRRRRRAGGTPKALIEVLAVDRHVADSVRTSSSPNRGRARQREERPRDAPQTRP